MSEGGVILYPTDTIWGIGCDATNEEAVRRVYEIKQRSDSKAMLVLVDSPVKVDFYVQDVPEVAWDLIELADKPLTIIYSGARNLAPNLLAEDFLFISAGADKGLLLSFFDQFHFLMAVGTAGVAQAGNRLPVTSVK